MATKYEIKKFIEKKKKEAVSKLKIAHCESLEQAGKQFVAEWAEYINPVREYLAAAGECLEKFIKAAGGKGIRYHERYSGPGNYIRNAEGYLEEDKVSLYFHVPAIAVLKNKQEQEIEGVEAEYTRLIAVTGSMGAKDGIDLLKNLGFDTLELEVPKEMTTALITNIDASKLHIV